MEKFKIKHHFSTPYHSKTNGLVERFNRTLCESLAKLGEKKKEWNNYIALTLFAYRTSKQSSTKIESFYLTYGRKARSIFDEEKEILTGNIWERINHIIEELLKERNQIKEQIKKSQRK